MKNNKFLILYILIGILMFSFLGYKIYGDFFKSKEVVKELDSISLYGYTLSDKDTKVYETKFNELRSILNEKEIDYEKYASLISELFVIDLFTLNNKLGSTDIGGLEFLHKDLKDNFKEYIGNTLYKHMEINIDGNRKQSLIEVSNTTVNSVKQDIFVYNEEEYESYIVDITIEYTNETDYQNQITITLINDNKILYIVKAE